MRATDNFACTTRFAGTFHPSRTKDINRTQIDDVHTLALHLIVLDMVANPLRNHGHRTFHLHNLAHIHYLCPLPENHHHRYR